MLFVGYFSHRLSGDDDPGEAGTTGEVMGLRIGTNVASISAQRNLARNEERTLRAVRSLASGSRVVAPGDDAAGFAISEVLRGQAASLEQAKRNAQTATGLIQVAEGGLNEQNNILLRLRELAIQAASDTVGSEERGFLNVEYQQLVQEFDRIAMTTTFGRRPLLSGAKDDFEFHLGSGGKDIDVVRYRMDTDTRASSLGIKGTGVEDRSDARSSLSSIDDAVSAISKARAGFGAIQSRLEIAANNLDLQRENILMARSRIADADVAEEVSKVVQGRILRDFGTSILAQANQDPIAALKLL
jgi:flagellin